LDFGSLTIRSASTRNVTVSNCGSAPLNALAFSITAVDASGELDPELFVVGEAELPKLLTPGEFVTIPIRFRPIEVGEFQAQLQVTLANPEPSDPTQTIALVGRGRMPGECAVLNPASLSFGTVEVGNTLTQAITVSNAGEEPCAL